MGKQIPISHAYNSTPTDLHKGTSILAAGDGLTVLTRAAGTVMRGIRGKLGRLVPRGTARPNASSRSDTIPVLTGRAAADAIHDLAAKTTYDAIPETVLHDAKRLLLLGIAGSVMGQRWPEDTGLPGAIGIAGDSGDCTVFGAGCRAGCAESVSLNAYHAQVHDCNDGLAGRGAWHAGRVLVPAALGVAEQLQTSGRDALTALVVGYEVAHRAYVESRRCRGDGIGAAAMTAKLLGLPHDPFIHAIYLADQHGPHLYPGARNIRTSSNQICSAMIARTAVESALLAQAGATADPSGTQLCLVGDLPTPANPSSFLTSRVYIKPYVACRSLHGAIEAALEFRESEGERVGDIEKVDVRVVDCADFNLRHTRPDDYYKIGQFSIPYTMACAFLFGEVEEAQFTRDCIRSDAVQGLQKLISAEKERENTVLPGQFKTDVTVTLKNGRQVSVSREYPRGAPETPLTDQEVVAQFNRWAGDSFDVVRKQKIVEAVFNLEHLESVRELTHLLRP